MEAQWSVETFEMPVPSRSLNRVQYHPTSYALLQHAVEEYHLIAALADEIRDEIDREIIQELLTEMRRSENASFDYAYKALGVVN